MTRELFTLGLAGLAANLLIYGLLDRTGMLTSRGNAVQWLMESTLLWAFVWQQIWRHRHLNRPSVDSPLASTLGWANRLTIMRGWLIAATGGFLFLNNASANIAWAAAALYSVAAILDRVDGYVARRTRQTSLLGSELDMRVDALGLLVAPLLAFELGKIHWSYLLVSAAYYLFQGGLYWRNRRRLPVYSMVENKLRRTLAGFQMGLIAFVLWPPFREEVTVIASVAFMIPVLTGFAVDWLVVSGVVDPTRPVQAKFFERLEWFSHCLFQPALRCILLFTALWLLRVEINQVPSPSGVLIWLCVVMVLLGFAARIGALVMILLLAWQFPELSGNGAVSSELVLFLFSIVWIMLMGSGRFSLWQWDDSWVQRYDGAG